MCRMADSKRVTVLRLKRKREEDPFQSLLVHSSQTKKAKDIDDSLDMEDYIFRFMKTSTEKIKVDSSFIEEMEKTLKGQISNDGVHKGTNAFKNDVSEDSKMKMPVYDCYTITSSMTAWDTSGLQRLKANDVKDEIMLEVYDVAKEHIQKGNHLVENSDAILCNSIKMIREKLTISEDSEIQDPEYVYDLYFAQEKHLDATQATLYIHALDHDILCNESFEETLQDEDDSNDESNWRNDYPDEDQFFSSGEDEVDGGSDCSEDSSSDAEEFDYYRHQSRPCFDPFTNDTEQFNFLAYEHDGDDDYDDNNYEYAVDDDYGES